MYSHTAITAVEIRLRSRIYIDLPITDGALEVEGLVVGSYLVVASKIPTRS